MAQSSQPVCRVVCSFEVLVGCIPKDTPETSAILILNLNPVKPVAKTQGPRTPSPRVSNPSVEITYLLDNPKAPSTQ